MGDPVQLTRGPSDVWVHARVPDGKQIGLLMPSGQGTELWLTDLDGAKGGPRRLTSNAGAEFVSWDYGTDSFIVLGSWGGQGMTVKNVPLGGGEPRTAPLLTPATRNGWLLEAEVSRDGNLVALLEEEQEGDVWVLQAARGSF
jgi:hypothetical protein